MHGTDSLPSFETRPEGRSSGWGRWFLHTLGKRGRDGRGLL